MSFPTHRPAPRHHLRLHDEDGALERALVQFVSAGLCAGEGVVVIARPGRCSALGRALEQEGHDVARLLRADRLLTFDAVDLLSRVRRDGVPRPELLHEHVGAAVDRLAGRGPVRVYGEMVDVLLEEGDAGAALGLERLWDVAVAERDIQLLCGYGMDRFLGEEGQRTLEAVCAGHTRVLPCGEVAEQSADALRREVARLQRAVAAHTAERARWQRSEDALGLVAYASDALSGTLDPDEVARGVLRVALPALGDFGFVDLVGPEGVRRRAAAPGDPATEELLAGTRWVRSSREDLNVCALSSGQPALHARIDDAWLQDVALSPEHLDLMRRLGFVSMVTVPLVGRGRLLGALTLFHARSGRRHDARDLRVVLELAHRAAAALDNARLYREARAAMERWREADRRKDEFLAMLGHELRNPLAPIVLAVELMDRRGDRAGARERAIISRQARHLARMVDDLLDLSRIERGLVTLVREPVAVDDLVARALEQARPAADPGDRALRVEVPSGLWVNVDPVRLVQVLVNLLGNAARYTPSGGAVSVRAAREGEQVRIEVEDDGIGLPPELLERVFEPFVQGPRALDRAGGGLGLGLAIARELAELHGGTLGAASAGPGQGSRFTLRLPACSAPARVAAASGPPAPPAAARRVLVVDDNTDAAELLGMALRAAGYDVVIAHNALEALDRAAELPPRMALVDLGLPGMNGLELAPLLRARCPDLRLVALTGYGQAGDRTRSREAGFDEHLVKPATLAEIQAALG